jgi:hypothetical protein
MTERLDAHNVSVDTTLAQAGACARIHLPTGWICALSHRHRGSCQFVSPADLADAGKPRSSRPGRSGASCS